ncbi:phage portal protein [Peribacillus castrilensis]|uniref:Phage portal protein n=1 Tax=Peribacillus castrilensis TaxID=2897690 RepID=A0AAW9NB09_9BACI|nr:phage portal protein [Peribacillus castrilensis]
MGLFDSIFSKNKALASSYDYEFAIEATKKVYLKEIALETCINFIARTISQTEFRYMREHERIRNELDYAFNVRPNTDMTASDFWQTVIANLISDNEVLIIPYQDQLLIADSFIRNEYALFPDTFQSVTVKNFMFNRKVWNMDEVIYLTYNNKRLTSFMDGLINDYAELFGSLIESSKRSFQIRGAIKFDTSHDLNDTEKTQSLIDKITGAVRDKVTAIFPLFKGISYEEFSNGSVKGPSHEDINKVKRALIDDVANILGIPINLLHGDVADLDSGLKAYIKLCINPLVKKITDELNAKTITRQEYQDGEHIKAIGVKVKDIFELAAAFDKLIASGTFTRNELREEAGFNRSDNPKLDEFILTKNYESIDEPKGGENE